MQKDETRRLDVSSGFIETGGKRLVIHDRLSTHRFEMLEQLKVRIQYGNRIHVVLSETQAAYDELNSMRFGDAAVRLKNNVIDVGNAYMRESGGHPMLLAATLWLSFEGEETPSTSWNEAKANEMLNLINEAGYDFEDFYLFAKKKMKDLLKFLSEDIQSTSQRPSQEH
jgi:hypothetical protein